MPEFTPITTQADFDAAMQPLIDAAVSAKAAEFEGFISPDEHQQALDALTASHKSEMLKSYREKAAVMSGLPAELAERLTGDTEEDIRKDAEMLAAFTKKGHGTPSFTSQYETEMSGVEKHFYEKNPDLAPKTGKE